MIKHDKIVPSPWGFNGPLRIPSEDCTSALQDELDSNFLRLCPTKGWVPVRSSNAPEKGWKYHGKYDGPQETSQQRNFMGMVQNQQSPGAYGTTARRKSPKRR